jgi:hypothetical protein
VGGAVVLGSVGLLTAFPASPARAATLGAVAVTPTSASSDAQLFDGSIAAAACPAGTDSSFFSLEGGTLTPYAAYLGDGTGPGADAMLAPAGNGPQSFSGVSIANIETATGGALADGAYRIVFHCFTGPTVTDTYESVLTYTGAGSGAWSVGAVTPPSPTASPTPSPTATAPVATAPGAPGTPAASAPSTGGSATVAWSAPSSDGGSAITSYTVQAHAGTTLVKTVTGVSGTSTSVTGLANGTAYTFTAAAVNAVGTGASSAASNTVTPRLATKLVLTSAPSLLTYGVAPKVVGKLTRANGTTPVSGQSVQLQVRKKGTSTYKKVAVVTSSSTGSVTFTSYKPGYAVDALRLVRSTAGAYLGAVSNAKAVSTQRRITAALSATQIALGKTAKLSGRVYPRSSGRTIVLQRKKGTSWVTVTSKALPSTTAGYSTYAFTVKPAAKGTFVYRVVIGAASGYARSVSVTRALKVV